MKHFPKPVGERIKQYRKKKGFSQVDLSGRTNLDALTIRRAEKNTHEPSYQTMILLGTALNVAPVNFYDLDELRDFIAGHLDDSLDISKVRRPEQEVHDYTFIERYEKLPKRYSNQFFKFTFTNEVRWDPVKANEAEHMFDYGFESGNSISGHVKIDVENNDNPFNWIYTTVYANGDIAASLLELKSEVKIQVVAKSIYGVIPDLMHSVRDELCYGDLTGFLIEKIVKVARQSSSPD